MAYSITGLDPLDFAALVSANDDALRAAGAVRVIATASPGYPCRITLEDAAIGEPLILLHHLSHDVATPYRAAYAIYVREQATVAAHYNDAVPPVLQGRPISLRGFGADGLLKHASLALVGDVDGAIRALFAKSEVAYIHAHNAAHGCFVAQIDRA